MINTIVTDLLNIELAGGETYTTSQLIQIIKQKYPDASSAIIMGVINTLAGQITKVASITKNTWDNKPVTYWSGIETIKGNFCKFLCN